jgi:hypothetical protein
LIDGANSLNLKFVNNNQERNTIMNKLATLTLISLLLVPLAALHAAEPTTTQPIDQKTLDEWSAPYRGWHYYPDPVIPSDWKIPANEKFHSYDVPTARSSATATTG